MTSEDVGDETKVAPKARTGASDASQLKRAANARTTPAVKKVVVEADDEDEGCAAEVMHVGKAASSRLASNRRRDKRLTWICAKRSPRPAATGR